MADDCKNCHHLDKPADAVPCVTCPGMAGLPGSAWVQMTPPATGTEGRVCADIAARQAFGIAKYGTTVADNPLVLRQWLQHAYEETLDQAVYLRRAMDEMDARGG